MLVKEEEGDWMVLFTLGKMVAFQEHILSLWQLL